MHYAINSPSVRSCIQLLSRWDDPGSGRKQRCGYTSVLIHVLTNSHCMSKWHQSMATSIVWVALRPVGPGAEATVKLY